MSGGHFDYTEWHIEDIAGKIEQVIEQNKVIPEGWDKWCGEWHGQLYSDETIAKFQEAVKVLRIASVYAQRIDYLLCDDDGEETFHERLKEELEALEKRNYKYE